MWRISIQQVHDVHDETSQKVCKEVIPQAGGKIIVAKLKVDRECIHSFSLQR